MVSKLPIAIKISCTSMLVLVLCVFYRSIPCRRIYLYDARMNSKSALLCEQLINSASIISPALLGNCPLLECIEAERQLDLTQTVRFVAKDLLCCLNEDKLLTVDGFIVDKNLYDDGYCEQLPIIKAAAGLTKRSSLPLETSTFLAQLDASLFHDFSFELITDNQIILHAKDKPIIIKASCCKPLQEGLIETCLGLALQFNEKQRKKQRVLFDIRFKDQIVRSLL